ncbi:MAG: glycosyltransferase family 2 protein, partial [Litorivicinus sp.]
TFSDDLVHERVVVPGEPVRLAGVMGHESFTDLSQVLAKIDHYSGAWAEQAHARGRTASIGLAILKGFAAFLKTLLLKQGWRDGVHGWFLAATNGHGTFYKYAKLWLRAQ